MDSVSLPGRVGEGRACWSLGNAYVSMGSPAQALTFAKKHLEISQEVSQACPPAGDSPGAAQLPLDQAGRLSPSLLLRPFQAAVVHWRRGGGGATPCLQTPDGSLSGVARGWGEGSGGLLST